MEREVAKNTRGRRINGRAKNPSGASHEHFHLPPPCQRTPIRVSSRLTARLPSRIIGSPPCRLGDGGGVGGPVAAEDDPRIVAALDRSTASSLSWRSVRERRARKRRKWAWIVRTARSLIAEGGGPMHAGHCGRGGGGDSEAGRAARARVQVGRSAHRRSGREAARQGGLDRPLVAAPALFVTGAPRPSLKYQLHQDDLNSLIFVTSDDDVDHLIDKLDRIHDLSANVARLQVAASTDQWFVDALNAPVPHPVERGRSEASLIISEVPNYLFGLDTASDEPSPSLAAARAKSDASETPRHHGDDEDDVPPSARQMPYVTKGASSWRGGCLTYGTHLPATSTIPGWQYR
ncbi:hypothetical protein SORBI_3001G055800 [Sorghum bicolor]|uniref:Uncharacterized protein n=1 Tax=Sorghum bicolor TaxID=4558 RepID=A0A1B6QHG2_SORBI|nr:hypothetical protein SORBI_3001G055800 [Sorghum bicolor]